ncbi:MAG TPA: hypothetical protein VMF53_02350 [Alphaproteobacteria bacterium]|nr:hypothetical protein [Alphaproteobacteria bacterium]
MAKSYEESLKAEISQMEDRAFELYQQSETLRAQVEGLRQALALYLKTGQAAPITKGGPAKPPPGRHRARRGGSRFDEVLQFIKDSGVDGVTIEEMYQFAVREGLKLKRTSIRSSVWNHKTKGVLEGLMETGRYRMKSLSEPAVTGKTEGSTGVVPAEPSLKVAGGA